ncbi:uncharacterized protein [Aristolochia californica]|uniref:uncharacterized protein n=1 Tax=Aristolochia californica TaxID=171875 RepID=UPI0035E039DF
MDCTNFETCVNCIKGRQTNKSKKGANRNSDILEIIPTDIRSPDMDSHGQKYFISFIDDYSRCMYLYMLYNNNETLDAFKIFKAKVETQYGYRFYCPSHSTRIVESRNAKFLENDLISGSNPTLNIVSEKDHSESQPSTLSDKLLIVYNTPQVKTGVEQLIIEVPQDADDIPVDQVVQELPRTFEQLVEPHTSQEYDGTTLRRSTRPKSSTIHDDYVVYLQETDYNIGAKNDPKFFSRVMSCKESELWYNAMKEEMNSMKSS